MRIHFYFVKGQDFRHVGGDELDKLLAGKDPKSDVCGRWRPNALTALR
ncbi:MAG: hypothetical protein ACLR9W_06105 [Enterobacter hormaechei]